MSLITVMGTLDVHPEDAESVAELMRTMMNETVKEAGCDHYAFSMDLGTANRFQLSEVWQDDASLSAHFRSEHMAVYRAGLQKMRVLKRVVRRYEVSAIKEL